ncbi:hypothetical protein QUF89_21240 [Peribacillus simplex]|uniref:Uncharacterized protein n=1 Tax=Peribacillus simplex TaxID=1478 RepID=A0AAW7IF48_9BACI|nr:hypothetical protein [Peribacillus simplex]
MKAGWLRFGANIIDGIIIGNPTGILSVFMSIFLSGAMELEEKTMDPLFLPMLSFLYYSVIFLYMVRECR